MEYQESTTFLQGNFRRFPSAASFTSATAIVSTRGRRLQDEHVSTAIIVRFVESFTDSLSRNENRRKPNNWLRFEKTDGPRVGFVWLLEEPASR